MEYVFNGLKLEDEAHTLCKVFFLFYSQLNFLQKWNKKNQNFVNKKNCIRKLHKQEVFCFSATRKVYACEVDREHNLTRKEGGGFSADEYQEFPERYVSVFAQKVRNIIY